MTRDCVDSIELRTDPNVYDLIICDNFSTQTGMKEYLDFLETKYTVIRNKGNLYHNGWKPGLKFIKENYNTPYVVMSDPDILLYQDIPKDWPLILSKFMDFHIEVAKVGLALDISYLPSFDSVVRWESQFWMDKHETSLIDDTCYKALISTTMSMVRWDTFLPGIEFPEVRLNGHDYNNKYKISGIRIAGRFVCGHLGWGMDEKYNDDFEFLVKLDRRTWVTSIPHYLGMLTVYDRVNPLHSIKTSDSELKRLRNELGKAIIDKRFEAIWGIRDKIWTRLKEGFF